MSGCTCEPGVELPQPHPPWDCRMAPAGWEEDVEQQEHLDALIADAEQQQLEAEARADRLTDEMAAAGYDPMGLDGGDR